MNALFDTNILIDYLNGEIQAKQEIARYQVAAISIITYIEVLVGIQEEALISPIKAFLQQFLVIAVDSDIAERAIRIRKQLKLKVPDAIILATAEAGGYILVTRNSRDFKPTYPGVTIPYQL